MAKYLTLIIVALIAYFVHLRITSQKPPKNARLVFGEIQDQRFARLREVFHCSMMNFIDKIWKKQYIPGGEFRQNYANGYEKAGSSFAVYHRGKLVVDLWGGYADAATERLWSRNTLSIVFSATKAVCSLVGALLVDRRLLDYDHLVTEYWPEFGRNGKENMTVATLLGHHGGLAYLDRLIEKEDVRNGVKMAKYFEDQSPNWTPGTKLGYHALTYGFIVDQLVRKVDRPKHRSLGQFIHDEITVPNDVDFYLGLPLTEYHRFARHIPPTLIEMLEKLMNVKALILQFNIMRAGKDSPLAKAFGNPTWLQTSEGGLATNDPDILNLEIGAANGVSNARGLAKIYSLYERGILIKNETLRQLLAKPQYVQESDFLIGLVSDNGFGFGYAKTPEGNYEFGHPGYGGQNVKVNPTSELAYAYVTNGLTPDMGDNAHNYASLRSALYEIVQNIGK